MANLTPDQIADAQAWIHDILVAGGIYAHPKRAIAIDDYYYMYGNHKYRDNNERADLMSKARELCDIIKNRKVDTQVFKQLTDLLEYFSNKCFYTPLGGATDTKKNSNVLAKFLCWFCSEYEFLWDDSTASTYEMEIILNTAIGKTLKSFKCFTSQYSAPSKSTRTPKASAGNTNGAAGGSKGQPQNDFKSRGALSNVAIDLLSTPNQKEYLSTPIYCVNGVDANGVVGEDTA